MLKYILFDLFPSRDVNHSLEGVPTRNGWSQTFWETHDVAVQVNLAIAKLVAHNPFASFLYRCCTSFYHIYWDRWKSGNFRKRYKEKMQRTSTRKMKQKRLRVTALQECNREKKQYCRQFNSTLFLVIFWWVQYNFH